MQFSLSQISNDNKIHQFTYSNSAPIESKIISIENLSELNSQAIFYERANLPLETLSAVEALANSVTLMPNFNQTLEAFEYDMAYEAFISSHRNWIISNNLRQLNDLFPTLTHLKNLYPHDRTSFFEELWSILKTNLGSKSLTIIFNDIVKSKKEGVKDKLVRVKIEGEVKGNPISATEIDEKVFENYRKDFFDELNICEFNADEGQLVATVKVQESPILIMAEIYQFTALQRSLLNALFSGINF
jgi:hypothetical protein